MAWKGYGDWLKKANESGYYFSDADLASAAQSEDFANKAYDIKDRYAKAVTDEDRSAIHQEMEDARNPFSYSGGVQGDEYNPWETQQPPQLQQAAQKVGGAYDSDIEAQRGAILDRGEYVSPWAAEIQGAVSAILNREPFSYDYKSDPNYASYAKAYTREGRRASEDVMGQYAAMTGGMPSTAAMTAASQAGDYYASKLADKIPELYAAAYAMYQNEGNEMLQRLQMLRGLDSDAYGRWSDEGSRQMQNLDMLRALDSDAWRKQTNQRDFDYQAEQDRQAREMALAQMGIGLGDYSKAAELGLDVDEAADAVYAYGSGDPYRITSGKGKAFVSGAQPGQTMRGGDGSQWTKNADGSVTITRGDDTWTIAVPAAAASGGGYSGGYYGGGMSKTAAEQAFNSGDHSDAVIKALIDAGYSESAIRDAGYTGNYFKQGSGTGNGQQARHIYETVMNEVSHGGSAADAQAFAASEIQKGLANGSITEDEADRLMKMFGY